MLQNIGENRWIFVMSDSKIAERETPHIHMDSHWFHLLIYSSTWVIRKSWILAKASRGISGVKPPWSFRFFWPILGPKIILSGMQKPDQPTMKLGMMIPFWRYNMMIYRKSNLLPFSNLFLPSCPANLKGFPSPSPTPISPWPLKWWFPSSLTTQGSLFPTSRVSFCTSELAVSFIMASRNPRWKVTPRWPQGNHFGHIFFVVK